VSSEARETPFLNTSKTPRNRSEFRIDRSGGNTTKSGAGTTGKGTSIDPGSVAAHVLGDAGGDHFLERGQVSR